jgi:hypothetical protein
MRRHRVSVPNGQHGMVLHFETRGVRRCQSDGLGAPDFRGEATYRHVRTCHDAFWLGGRRD